MLLKKLISYFLLPYPLMLVLLIVGAVLLWFTARQRTGKVMVTVAVCAMLLVSWPVTSGWLLTPLLGFRPLQNPAAAAGARWVVVLGSGYSTSSGIPPNGRLDPSGLQRLVEGIRLYRAIPGAKLLVSGGVVLSGSSTAEVMAEAAVVLGTPRADVVLEAESRDTQDEAVLIRRIVGSDRFVLVTSASHMRRSMRLFQKLGMMPIPAPSGFWSNATSVLPSSSVLMRADEADHEYLGLLWSRLRGTI